MIVSEAADKFDRERVDLQAAGRGFMVELLDDFLCDPMNHRVGDLALVADVLSGGIDGPFASHPDESVLRDVDVQHLWKVVR